MSRMDHARAFRLLEGVARDVQLAPGPAEARVRLLRAAAAEFGAGSATFFEPGARGPAQTGSIETPRAILERYLAHRPRYERSNRAMFVALEAGPAIDGLVYRARERDRLAIYDEVFKPQRVRSILATWLSLRGRRLGVLVLKRHDTDSVFKARDAALLARLGPFFSLVEAGLRAGAACEGVSLSPRVGEVAALASKGLHDREIAALLGTSVGTVKKQMRAALERAGVSNRTELAAELSARRD